MFRQPSPRSPVPPSSFPSGLQPVGSNDVNGGGLHRRVSRTDLDFEQALRGEGTVVIREGLDVDSLGLDVIPHSASSAGGSPYSSPPTSPPPRTPYMSFQPPTPTIVPPTPSPQQQQHHHSHRNHHAHNNHSTTTSANNNNNHTNHNQTNHTSHNNVNRVNGSSSSSTRGQSSVSSGSDIFYDAEDSELQTKRRSMYRSPGTASSPDLATLLRKAKSRDTGKDANRSSRPVQQPLIPNRLRVDDASQRPSITTNSPSSPGSPRTPLMKGKSRASGQSGAINGERSSDWVLTSPRSMSNMKEGFKVSSYGTLVIYMCVCGLQVQSRTANHLFDRKLRPFLT